jgi:CRISPR-associated endonuclease Cas1
LRAGPRSSASNSRQVLVVDGYGVDLRVDRGALVLRDGLAKQRRERRLYRSDRTVRRIVVLSSTGNVTLAALRWCSDVGIAVVVLDPQTYDLLAVNGAAVHDDARLRRGQAFAGNSSVGLDIARKLISAKFDGQADTIRTCLGDLDTETAIRGYLSQLDDCQSLDQVRNVESNAAATYFRAWRGVSVRFARADTAKVPPGWLSYSGRKSDLSHVHSPAKATDPVNAMANFCYRLVEVEAVLACHALGLDPGLGVLHADQKGRDSLALDLMEPVRPAVDAFLLDLVRSQVFSRRDFVETRDGQIRVLPPLTETLAATMPRWAELIAPYAEMAAHAIADSVTGVTRRRTPLTGKPKSSPRRRRTAAPMQAPVPRCLDCGAEMATRRQKRCAACNTSHVTGLAHARATHARERLADLRATGTDPSQTAEARGKRSASIASNRAALAAWQADNPNVKPDPQQYWKQVHPLIGKVSIPVIARTLGVSVASASRIRSGSLLPHARHWPALTQLGGGGSDDTTEDPARSVRTGR